MQTVTEIARIFGALLTLGGICLGAALIIKSGFLFLTARGNVQQINKAKYIVCRSVVGMVLFAANWIIFLR